MTETNELKEVTDLLKRTQANFENFQKQTEKRMLEMQEMASADIIAELLPIMDNLELALKNREGEDEFTKGIELIYSQFKKLLDDNEVKEIETKGEFDPNVHEALMKEESEEDENKIIAVFQKGYTLHGKVLRNAKVKISGGKSK